MNWVKDLEFEKPVRDYLTQFNGEMSFPRSVGEVWVRVKPATREDVVASAQDNRFIPFIRPGSRARVTDLIGRQYVEVEVNHDRVLYDRREFLATFLRVTEWHQFFPVTGEGHIVLLPSEGT